MTSMTFNMTFILIYDFRMTFERESHRYKWRHIKLYEPTYDFYEFRGTLCPLYNCTFAFFTDVIFIKDLQSLPKVLKVIKSLKNGVRTRFIAMTFAFESHKIGLESHKFMTFGVKIIFLSEI